MSMTRQRAEEIRKLILSTYPRLVIHTSITAAERAEIDAYWRRLRPRVSYHEALKRMGLGCHLRGVDPEPGAVIGVIEDDE